MSNELNVALIVMCLQDNAHQERYFEYFLLFSTYDYWFNYLSYTIFPRRKNDLVVRIWPFDQWD
jgi:hypothetical protein